MARDGILAADAAMEVANPSYESEKCLIWKTFARRGLGLSANSGTVNSRSDQTPAFDIPAECASYGQVKVVVAGPGSVTPGGMIFNSVFSQSLELELTPDAGATLVSAAGCDGELDGTTFTTPVIVDTCTIRIQFTGPDYLFEDSME